MTTIEYKRPEHAAVPVEQVLDYIAKHLPYIIHISCSETFNLQAVRKLCKILLQQPQHTSVESLSLPRNDLDASVADTLANLLYFNTTIHSLDLCKNNLGPDGVKALVQPLVSTNITLVTLNLTQNNLWPSAASPLATMLGHTTSLETLKLGHNHFGPRGIRILAPRLGACRSLKTLSLSHNEMGSKGVSELAKELKENKSSLVYLDISCNRAGTKGTRSIADWLMHSNRTLQTLVMASNHCDTAGARELASVLQFNHTLRHLNFGGNSKVGDIGAEVIAKKLQEHHYLESLNLDWNHIGNTGATALANALKHNSSLVELKLSGNHIGNSGSIALAKALPYNPMLKRLDVSQNQLDDVAAEAFADALVGPNRVFESLNYEGNQSISESGTYRIEQAFRYRTTFRNWFGPLLEQTQLSTLDLSSRNIGDEEVISLANRLANDSKPKSTLQSLYVGGNLVTARGMSHFAHEYLAKADSCRLARFHVRNCRMGNEGATAIAVALKTTRSLRVLSLTCSGITLVGARALGNAFQENTTLQRLSLDGNNIGEGATAIAVALKTNSSLRVLSLTSCGITLVGARALGDAFQENTTLQRLILDGNNIGDAGLAELVATLEQSPSSSLTSLSVDNNGITDEGIGSIVGTRLKEVNLSNNKITDRGALDLARSLLDNNNDEDMFEYLNLSGNEITPRGGEALARFLPPRTKLTY